METARYMIAFVAVFNFGGVVADAIVPAGARQHVRNPRWPPHAKFHNWQTMLMGVFSGALSLVILFGAQPLTLASFLVAAAIAANYFAAMAFAPFFPGTAWSDPEFAAANGRPPGLAPQQLVSYALCSLALIAVALAVFADARG